MCVVVTASPSVLLGTQPAGVTQSLGDVDHFPAWPVEALSPMHLSRPVVFCSHSGLGSWS